MITLMKKTLFPTILHPSRRLSGCERHFLQRLGSSLQGSLQWTTEAEASNRSHTASHSLAPKEETPQHLFSQTINAASSSLRSERPVRLETISASILCDPRSFLWGSINKMDTCAIKMSTVLSPFLVQIKHQEHQ